MLLLKLVIVLCSAQHLGVPGIELIGWSALTFASVPKRKNRLPKAYQFQQKAANNSTNQIQLICHLRQINRFAIHSNEIKSNWTFMQSDPSIQINPESRMKVRKRVNITSWTIADSNALIDAQILQRHN